MAGSKTTGCSTEARSGVSIVCGYAMGRRGARLNCGTRWLDQAYGIHPGLLDACFHVVAAALADDRMTATPRAYLPLSVGRFWRVRPRTARLWSRARIRRDEPNIGDMVRADVSVFDESGQLVVEATDLRLRGVTEDTFGLERDAASAQWLYEVAWVPAADGSGDVSSRRPTGEQIAALVRPRLASLETQHKIDRYRALLPQLDALSLAYVLAAFDQLGWDPLPGERVTTIGLADALGVSAPHRRLLGRMLEILVEEKYLERHGHEWEVLQPLRAASACPHPTALVDEFPPCAPILAVAARCGERLSAVLRGQCDPLSLLFPDGSLDFLERVYEDAPFAQYNNAVMREVLAAVAPWHPQGQPLRVLEIGAGTGASTAWLLPVLPADRTEYVYTDVSPAFTSRARRKFSGYPFVHYELLNIEIDPTAQGFAGRRFDIVVAANVLHATKDLRQTLTHVCRLLDAGGLLVMLEGTGPMRWVDLTFGMTDGWWRFTDLELRPSYPLITRARWLALLAEMGFVHSHALPAPEHGEGDGWQTAIFARAPEAAPGREPSAAWLIFGTDDGLGARLADRVRAGGDQAVLVHASDVCDVSDEGSFRADPTQPEHIRQVVAAFLTGHRAAGCHLVHCWGLNAPDAQAMTVSQLQAFERTACGSVLHLVQALSATAQPPRLWLVTRGAQPLDSGQLAVAQAPLWGVGKVVAQEHPELRCTCVDLDPAAPADEVDGLYRLIRNDGLEDRVGFRDGRGHVARLIRRSTPEVGSAESSFLDITRRGTFENLVFRRSPRRPPGPGEIELEVRATGLNFKDVLNALGAYPAEVGPLGHECAGTVVALGSGSNGFRVGDEVVGIVPRSFGRYATTRAELVTARPRTLSPEQAATIPVAFLTAHYALSHLAQLAAGDSVLIRSATGGVGLAAVQLARQRGAQVFATAGTPHKRQYLHSIGISCVLDSRSPEFATEIMRETAGRGVDVVLNSLSGELATASLEPLWPLAGGSWKSARPLSWMSANAGPSSTAAVTLCSTWEKSPSVSLN